MELVQLKHDDWKNYFSGRWSILSGSYWGEVYAKQPFSKLVDRFVSDTVLIVDETKGLSGYFRSSEIDAFSQNLTDSIIADPSAVTFICDGLKARADKFLELVDKHISQDLSLAAYLKFQYLLMDYYVFHIQNKYAPEKMTAKMLDKYFLLFESARVHAEPVFMRSEELMKELAKIHADKTGLEPELVLAMVDTEWHEYLKSGNMPELNILKERNKRVALVTQNHITEPVAGSEIKIVEGILSRGNSETISGTTAYPGKAEGVARLVFDPTKAAHFKEGDILVTKMTRPDYLPLMKKASAFVTDGGGILSHAAIVARELKKPCLIGTQVATEQIKDGDRIIVDADQGVVNIISREKTTDPK